MPRVAEVSVQTVLVPDMKRAADDWPAFAAKASLPTFPNQAVDDSFALYGGIAQQRAALSLPALVEGGRPGVTGGSHG